MNKHNSLKFWLIVLVLSTDPGALLAMDRSGTAQKGATEGIEISLKPDNGVVNQVSVPSLTLEQSLNDGKLQAAQAAFKLGVKYAENSDWSHAAAMLQEAVQLQPDNSYYLHAASKLAFKLKDYAAASKYQLRVIRLHQEQHGQNNKQLVKMMDELTAIYLAESDYLDAGASLEKTLMLREGILDKSDPDIALNLYWLAKVNIRLGELGQAELELGEALKILNLSEANQDSNIAFILNSMGDLYQVRREYLKAEFIYQQAITLWSKEPEHNKYELSVLEKKLAALDSIQQRLDGNEKQAGKLQDSSFKL